MFQRLAPGTTLAALKRGDMRKLNRITSAFLGSGRTWEMLLVGIALVLMVVIDTGSLWTWIVPLLVAVTLLMILRQGPRHGPRPTG
jgi:hypothetical protein